MSLIAETSGNESYPAVALKNLGDSVTGRIVSIEDYTPTEFGSTEPRKNPKTGEPDKAVRIGLETTPGDPASRRMLWADKWRMIKAIAVAVKAKGAADLEIGGDLAVQLTGRDGRAHVFTAVYELPESDAPF
jgi:hypothetical protein